MHDVALGRRSAPASGESRWDVAVIGAGCIGASTAKHLAEMGHSVVVLEKEAGPALHQSGRNSGVIHAGYNLAPGSEKARFCVEGSRRMRAYCRERGVAMEQGGILVVAPDEERIGVVDDLMANGQANGVQVRRLSGDEIPDVEPHAVGTAALHAPEGASVDARGYVQALVEDAQAAGAAFRFGVRVRSLGPPVRTDRGDVDSRVVVNAAGLHADRLAAEVAPDVRILPFRGAYAALRPEANHLVRSHIYAAPDPQFPFLGVHLSRRVDGTVAAGPGALLAFGREAYRPSALRPDLLGTLTWPGFWRLLRTPAFRTQVGPEVRKSLSLRAVWKEARQLVPALRPEHLTRGVAAGNRAQMVRRDGSLVEDIMVRETADAVHVLNAVSPGLTCSLPFGEHLAQRAHRLL